MKVAIILANGFEEIEAISIIDILRRVEIDALGVGLEKRLVTGAHGVEIKADIVLDELNLNEFEMIVLPGGLPGAQRGHGRREKGSFGPDAPGTARSDLPGGAGAGEAPV